MVELGVGGNDRKKFGNHCYRPYIVLLGSTGEHYSSQQETAVSQDRTLQPFHHREARGKRETQHRIYASYVYFLLWIEKRRGKGRGCCL